MGCGASSAASGSAGPSAAGCCGGGDGVLPMSEADATLAQAKEADKKHHRVLLLGEGSQWHSMYMCHRRADDCLILMRIESLELSLLQVLGRAVKAQ